MLLRYSFESYVGYVAINKSFGKIATTVVLDEDENLL